MRRALRFYRPMSRRHIVCLATAFSLGLACLSPASGQAREGEAEFKARCAKCHGPRDVAAWGRVQPDAAKRQAWLSRFLQKHYAPPEAERGRIIRYIEATIGK